LSTLFFVYVAFCLQVVYTFHGGDYMELSDRVRRRREELRLTQDELAKRMGYKSRVSINKIENGRPVSQKIISRLAEALNVSIPYLMGWDEKPAEELQGLGALAAEVIMDPDAMEMVKEYMQLSEVDRYAVRLVMASMARKEKETSAAQKKTDAGASVVEVEKSFNKA
jgi:transcriptional regulator with XRE-family HTH domain